MASVASQLIEEVTAHAQSESLEDAREICADGTYFPNNLRTKTVMDKRIWSIDGMIMTVENEDYYLKPALCVLILIK